MPLGSRLPNWRTALNAHIRAQMNVPHKWGYTDCVMWTSSCVKVITGLDYAKEYVGRYNDAWGALKLLNELGPKTPEKLVESLFGKPKHINLAIAGDIVACDLTKLDLDGGELQIGLTIGICNGPVCFFSGEDGKIKVPIKYMECAYNV